MLPWKSNATKSQEKNWNKLAANIIEIKRLYASRTANDKKSDLKMLWIICYLRQNILNTYNILFLAFLGHLKFFWSFERSGSYVDNLIVARISF